MQRRRFQSRARPADQRTRARTQTAGFSAWLALVALLLQVVVPVGQAIPLPAASESPLRTLVICTGTGTRVLDHGADTRGGASPSAAAGQSCPVCTALGLCGLPAPSVAAPLPAAAPITVAAAVRHLSRPDRAPLALRARGPPATVV